MTRLIDPRTWYKLSLIFFSNKILHSSVALQIVWGYKSMSKSLVHSALQWKNANAKKVIEIFFMKLMWSHLQFEKCFINVDCLGKHICFFKICNFLKKIFWLTVTCDCLLCGLKWPLGMLCTSCHYLILWIVWPWGKFEI